MRATTRSATVAALTLVFAAPLLGQATLLRVAPAEGSVSQYVIESETSMAGAVMSTTQIYRTETIASAAGDVIEIQAVIDSSTATAAIPGAATPDLSGMSYTFGMDVRGRARGLTDVGTLSPEAETAMRVMLAASFFELPEGEASPGDSWSGQATTEMPTAMGGTMTMETDITYTLVGLEGDLAEISLEGTVTMSGNAGGMMIDGTGGVSGTAIFDPDRSRLQSHDSVMDVDINAGGMATTMQTSTAIRLLRAG
ncbi:DUF6263 family protein [Candidatus Palauibacter sp.]|uniref:DUF6263 family protein n=1 Tax=Candidatus Palauibacter sp. TaxID=3101350 RepID=UPI003AF25E16